MTPQPFHHGNLRAVLLDEAERALRGGTAEDLSLRELARRAGVSHGAPRSHFPDRRALLDALAERGFERLTAETAAAAAAGPQDLAGRLRGVGAAYVRFAVTDAALLELMFSAKGASAPPGVADAAGQLFAAFDAAFGDDHRAGHLRGADLERTKLLLVSVLQGVASLIASHRITEEQGALVVDDAVALLVAGAGAGTAPPG